MPVDLAIDHVVGDLIVSPSSDVAIVSAQYEVAQRVWVHLKVARGTWDIDPNLGSTLHDVLRLTVERAVTQLPLAVKEALSGIEDVQVDDVVASPSQTDPRSVDFTVTYSIVGDGAVGGQATFTDTVQVTS